MIAREIPRVPDLPPNPEQSLTSFEAELHRAVLILHQSALSRARWLSSLRNYQVTSTPGRRMHQSLGRASGLFGLPATPWQFNIGADGNTWWPGASRVIAAEADGGGSRGRLGGIYQPLADGEQFDAITSEAPRPLSPGARTFFVKVSLGADLTYHAADTFQPGIPTADIEVVNLALGDAPPESPTSIYVPWVDVPPAAPPARRIPTYHFSLWFRFSHYWHPAAPVVVSSSGSSSSSSASSSSGSSSGSSSAPSSGSSSGKPIVP